MDNSQYEAEIDDLKDDIREKEEEIKELVNLAWDLLWQGASTENNTLNHKHISSYEDGCDYFEDIGWLRQVNDDAQEYEPTDKANREYPL